MKTVFLSELKLSNDNFAFKIKIQRERERERGGEAKFIEILFYWSVKWQMESNLKCIFDKSKEKLRSEKKMEIQLEIFLAVYSALISNIKI